ncbi:fused MFS/spermidine synthase [Roseovarius sp. EL26]|uniref:fused MFS/spermidine synthase n=1 Tax=Roseovarius sp. EL26 TaxID=2126672 RepID=UPI0020B16E5F|nr:fused MFS/spermidine synthase [Roseovarius sp. EL26]
MLFFQTVLIAGYLYAHLLTRYMAVKTQILIHVGIWALALFFLPLAIPAGWQFDPNGAIAWQALLLFGAGVGLPFFALSANAPLIQSWYRRSGGPSAADPYFLYGASNFGSLIALLGFPIIAEPLFGATNIGWSWTVGFVVLGGFLTLSGLMACRDLPATNVNKISSSKPTFRNRLYWAFLAFIPSSLMLSVTSKFSLDVGSLPLIWVIPLALYLLSFVLTFSNRTLFNGKAFKIIYAFALLALVLPFAGFVRSQFGWISGVLLFSGFFIVAVFAHRKLYEARPSGEFLTGFYLTMSIGGALGGFFNSIFAPLAFSGLYEAGVTLIVASILLVDFKKQDETLHRSIVQGLLIGVIVSIFLMLFVTVLPDHANLSFFFALLLCVFAFCLQRQNSIASCTSAGVLLAGGLLLTPNDNLLLDRSFFGLHQVREVGELRLYHNGNTIHGAQRLSDDTTERPEPLFYYHANGPMAQILTSDRGKAAQSVGVIGLGVGSLACYQQPGQSWQFYEIDRMVDEIARMPHLFRFMTACAADAPTHLGDARVVLAGQEGLQYDILIVDAYSSDAVPIHLTTIEAVQLYMDRLQPDGVLVLHISNRHYDIDIPLARSAAALGLEARIQHYGGNTELDPADSVSTVVTLSRNAEALGPLETDPRWEPLLGDGGSIWTDDHANVLSILR